MSPLFQVIVTEVVDGITFWAQNVDTGTNAFSVIVLLYRCLSADQSN